MFTAKWPTALDSNSTRFGASTGFFFAEPNVAPSLLLEKPVETPDSPHSFHHIPVLAQEVFNALRPKSGGIFVDGTLGGGGHSERLLQAGARVIGLDQDESALRCATERLRSYGEAFHPVRANFRDLGSVLDDLGVDQIDGLLLDIGVSSHQLDTAERGFSFQSDGPLDMRMNRSAPLTAADLVNTANIEELIFIFRKYGEEPSAARIAKHLVEVRRDEPFSTTSQLASAVESILPRRGRKHPATQVFQALRIAVNDELGALEAVLDIAPTRLKTGARFAVITFHSLEDRLVKQDFRRRSQTTIDRPEWPASKPNPACVYRLLNRKSITASPVELTQNPRARSARLRAVEKI